MGFRYQSLERTLYQSGLDTPSFDSIAWEEFKDHNNSQKNSDCDTAFQSAPEIEAVLPLESLGEYTQVEHFLAGILISALT